MIQLTGDTMFISNSMPSKEFGSISKSFLRPVDFGLMFVVDFALPSDTVYAFRAHAGMKKSICCA